MPLQGDGHAVGRDLHLQKGAAQAVGGDHSPYGHRQARAWPEGQHIGQAQDKWTTLGVWTGVLA